ncbi:MAG TPA: STY0301 family protein [Candidatus Binataceae bacterium]|nr:STY0301 family protein [Candidatus Binataceae bacterium]
MVSISRNSYRNRLIIEFALIAGIMFAMAPGAAADVLCPDTIGVVENATSTTGDWQVRDSGEKPELDRMTIYDGPPADQASLKYDREIKRKSEIVQIWNLAPSKRGYWLACGYSNTSKELYRKLPEMTAICEAILDRTVSFPNGGPVVRRVRCRAK